jgi:hypothetical protein
VTLANLTPLRLRNVTGQVITGQTFPSIVLDNCENVTLEGCTIDSPPLATANGQAVRIVNSRGVAMRGCDYNLQPASPARNRVANKARSFDIAGVAVAAVDSAGAYA